MKVTTGAMNHRVWFDWDGTIRFAGKPPIQVSYGVDVSKTPKHVVNFMFGMLLIEALCWDREPVVFEELTKDEQLCLLAFARSFHAGNRFGRSKGPEPPDITAERYVDPTPIQGGDWTIVDNGMGKDGLLSANLANELGHKFRCMTVANQFTQKKYLWETREQTMKDFCQYMGVEYDIVETNYMKKVAYKSIPWWVFGLPLAWHYGAGRIVMGLHIGNAKHYVENNAFMDMHISPVGLDLLSRGAGVRFDCYTHGLSEYGVLKLLVDRYPESLPYQRSCMNAVAYCGECGKCVAIKLYLEIMGRDPWWVRQMYGLQGKAPDDFKEADFADDQIRQFLAKRRGDSYEPWVEMASESVVNLMPSLANAACILAQHFSFYPEDPGSDGEGRTLEPSKWQDWIDQDYWPVIEGVRQMAPT